MLSHTISEGRIRRRRRIKEKNASINSCGINLNESERATICKVLKNVVLKIELQRKN